MWIRHHTHCSVESVTERGKVVPSLYSVRGRGRQVVETWTGRVWQRIRPSKMTQEYVSWSCSSPPPTPPNKNHRQNRPVNRTDRRETGLEMTCCPGRDLLWVQITQSYPNQLRFSNLPSLVTLLFTPSSRKDFGKVKTSFPTMSWSVLVGHQIWGMKECSTHLV